MIKKNILLLTALSFLFVTSLYAQEGAASSSDPLAQGAVLEQKGELLAALDKYNAAFEVVSDPDVLEELNTKIENLNIKILFSEVVDQYSFLYSVKPGDSLSKIAKNNKTTVDLLKQANNLSSDLIRIGEKLKVSKASFSVFVDKSQNILFLKRGDEILKTYRVATGADNKTPVGEFSVTTKLKNPVHFRKDIRAAVPPGSDKNVLGTRWLGFDIPGYGIHGHATPADLGNQVTLGCVRMLNKDVEELYTILPRGVKVTIVD